MPALQPCTYTCKLLHVRCFLVSRFDAALFICKQPTTAAQYSLVVSCYRYRIRCHDREFSDTSPVLNIGEVSCVPELGFVFDRGMGHVSIYCKHQQE